jgi:hypothetical protein
MDPLLIIAIDEGLDLNNIVHHVIEDLGHPIPYIEDRRLNERPRNENYYEVTIPQYTDIQFMEHFRISRRLRYIYIQDILNTIF